MHHKHRSTTAFCRQVYRLVQQIPPGHVATYQDIARYAGRPGAARAVGWAMSRNPNLQAIPCFRVVSSEGGLRGYAGGGVLRKRQLLQAEGVTFIRNQVNLALHRWQPDRPPSADDNKNEKQ